MRLATSLFLFMFILYNIPIALFYLIATLVCLQVTIDHTKDSLGKESFLFTLAIEYPTIVITTILLIFTFQHFFVLSLIVVMAELVFKTFLYYLGKYYYLFLLETIIMPIIFYFYRMFLTSLTY